MHHFQPFRVYGVGFGNDDQAILNAQQGQNVQMFHGLGHHAVIGGDHQHGKINAAGTGQHIFDEFLVARHIHDTRLGAVGPV